MSPLDGFYCFCVVVLGHCITIRQGAHTSDTCLQQCTQCCNQYNHNINKMYDHHQNVIYSCDRKAECSASLLQSSVSHDPSEIILIC